MARKLQPGALAQYADQAAALVKGAQGDTAKLALAQNLVTALKSREDVEEELKEIVGEDDSSHSYNSISLDSYLATVHSDGVLEIRIQEQDRRRGRAGEILDGKQPPGSIGGDSTSEILRDARHDDDIKAIVLRVDSPGGSVSCFRADLSPDQVAPRRGRKPVIVSMGSVAASGG